MLVLDEFDSSERVLQETNSLYFNFIDTSIGGVIPTLCLIFRIASDFTDPLNIRQIFLIEDDLIFVSN